MKTESTISRQPISSTTLELIRNDFPVLRQKINNRPIVYLDNASTTQKPTRVIEAVHKFYSEYNSNVHRGVHALSTIADNAYHNTREVIASFINAKHSSEVIFTKGTTESINLVAYSFGRKFIHEGDEIVMTQMEHHSNIVPWQILCDMVGAKIKVVPFDDNGDIDIKKLESLLNKKTKLLTLVWVSNSLGTVNPVKEIIDRAHEQEIPVLVDAAQAIPHMPVDVQYLDCDFLCFSGHKIYGPTGTGILYGKESWLEKIPPFLGGGDMIDKVTFEKTTYNELPFKFEAGTPNIAGVIGLKEAFEYVRNLGFDNILGMNRLC